MIRGKVVEVKKSQFKNIYYVTVDDGKGIIKATSSRKCILGQEVKVKRKTPVDNLFVVVWQDYELYYIEDKDD